MADEQTILKVGGKMFSGWTSVEVTRGIDALVGRFSIALTERWPGQPEEWGIEAGDACELFFGADKVMTGWIDEASYSLDPERHPVTVTGMERTGDLTDCSAIHVPGSWKRRKLEQIAGDLAKPFGISVKAIAPTGAAFAAFALQQGETVFEALDRMARQRGVLPVTTAEGDVELITPGKVSAGYTLEIGVSLEAVTFRNSLADRHSEYLLKGYSSDGKSRPKATAKDAAVARYRPLLIIHDDDSAPGNLSDRAKHEATVRAGRGQQVVATVTGWRAANGQLYRPDRLAPIKAKAIGIDGELLVYSVTYRLDLKGQRTELALAPKEAFSQGVIQAPRKRRRRSTPPPGTN